MAFHDERFPLCIEIGAVGGPRFKTTVIVLGSGHEKRNVEWSRTKGAWDVSSGIKEKADLEAMIAFFYARQGRAHGFRFRDWNDYTIGSPGAPVKFADGDGVTTEFQLAKRYTSGAYYFGRKITRPVSGTVEVYIDGSPPGSPNYTVDHDTGLVTFDYAPDAGSDIQVVAEFDVPVRFDQDELPIQGVFDGVQQIPQIMISEIRE